MIYKFLKYNKKFLNYISTKNSNQKAFSLKPSDNLLLIKGNSVLNNTFIFLFKIIFFIKKQQINLSGINRDSFEVLNKQHFYYLQLKNTIVNIIERNNNKLINIYNKQDNLYKNPSLLIYPNKNILPHKYGITKDFILNKQNIIVTSPKQKELMYKLYNVSIAPNIYKYAFNSIKKFIYYQELIQNLNYIYQFPGKAEDIVAGLNNIEIIFESKAPYFSNLIVSKISILSSKLSQFYINKNPAVSVTAYYIDIENQKQITLKKNYSYLISFFENLSSICSGRTIITSGEYSIDNINISSFLNNLEYNISIFKATKFSLFSSYNIILESITKQYNFNGIFLPTVHFELIIKKMTSCVQIEYSGDTIFEKGNLFSFYNIYLINSALLLHKYNSIVYKPKVLGITQSTLISSGMFASISFQETLKLLFKNVIESKIDWAVDLKSKIIASDLLPTGTGWYRYFNNI